MGRAGKILLSILFSSSVSLQLVAQSSISGVVNKYTSINELVFLDGNTVANAVKVSSTVGFNVGDTVMIYQPKGFRVDMDAGDEGEVSNVDYIGYTGKYSLMIIYDISDDTIVFNNTTGFSFAPANWQYMNGEVGQLIRVASYDNAEVNGTLMADPWDPVTNTGGVVALYIKEKLTLNAPIDVSGMGFRGADPSLDSYGTALCYNDDPAGFDDYFYPGTAEDIAGLKGEGAADTTMNLTRGRGSMINGGGGGNARYSGGGGGANFSDAGNGGNESEVCSPSAVTVTNGKAGYVFTTDGLYANGPANNVYSNRIFMGGGGGTGTQDLPDYPSSKGGNGGGIVVIIADTLEAGTTAIIRALGESVLTPKAGAGGGGGGGGTIVLDVSNFKGDITIDAKGGDGGNTNGAVYSGPGGGGGGGVYWLREDAANIIKGTDKGLRGKYLGQTDGQAGEGLIPGMMTGLRVPLSGFLFNTLPRDTEVCSDEKPPPIDATAPKGGDDTYNFNWYYRTDADPDWILDPSNSGPANEDYIFSGPLTTTTHYKREVTSGTLSASDSITYNVLQKIEGNRILASDTVCFGLEAVPFIQDGAFIQGGAEYPADFNYHWINSTDGGTNWSDTLSNNSAEGYSPRGLEVTTSFSRVITSGVCDDTSNVVIVTVLPSTAGNTISQDTIICYNQTPDQLTGPKPSGGDPAIFNYQWQRVTPEGTWIEDLVTTQNFSPPALSSSTSYQRIYNSGIQDACIDTSNIITINILPDITNNYITINDTTICAELTLPLGINASNPDTLEGGDDVYEYTWLQSSNGVTWTTAGGTSGQEDYAPGIFASTTYFSRWVRSGGEYDVCQDTSAAMKVTVLPVIQGNSITSVSDLVCKDILPDQLEGSAIASLTGGDDSSYDFRWEFSLTGNAGDADWAPYASLNSNPQPQLLDAPTYFRRKVFSPAGLKTCTSLTDTIFINVQDSILNNTISRDTAYVCRDYTLIINGTDQSTLLGGDETTYIYSWEDSVSGGAFSQIATTIGYNEPNYAGERSFRRIVESGVCTDTSIILTFPVAGLPTGTLTFTDPSNIYCENDDIHFQVEILGDGSAPYDIEIGYLPGDVNTPFTTADQNSMDIITREVPPSDGEVDYTYSLVSLTDANNCMAKAADLDGTVDITVYFTPQAVIPEDVVSVCGDSVELVAADTDDFYVTSWTDVNADIRIENEDQEIALAILERDRQDVISEYFTWSVSTPGGAGSPACADTDSILVFLYERPRALADSIMLKTDHDSVFVVDNYLLSKQTRSLDAGIETWETIGAIGSLSNDSTANINEPFVFGESQLYQFRYKVQNESCGPYFDELSITRLDLKVYDGFSPNGDMYNNALGARGLQYARRFECYIYNSWGTLVKKIDQDDVAALQQISEVPSMDYMVDGGVQVLWKGSMKDDESFVTPDEVVDDGVYFYKINLFMTDSPDESPYELTGSIILKTR